MSNSFNPSFGKMVETEGISEFDLCWRVPKLPIPSEDMRTKVLLDNTDGCFYRCVQEGDIWKWEKITNGVFRQYLFATTPLSDIETTVVYSKTADATPTEGVRYFYKYNGEYVLFTGSAFDPNTDYYVITLSSPAHQYTFNDIVDRLDSLVQEFKLWSVTFVSMPNVDSEGHLDNISFRDAVILLNEMIDHVNRYSNRRLSPYSVDVNENLQTFDPSSTQVGNFRSCLNNLISAVNPYTRVLTDIKNTMISILTPQEVS